MPSIGRVARMYCLVVVIYFTCMSFLVWHLYPTLAAPVVIVMMTCCPWLPKKARRRATRRLLASLPAKSRWAYLLFGEFTVTGSLGGTYVLPMLGPVTQRKPDQTVKYCIHFTSTRWSYGHPIATRHLPKEDQLLALALLLVTDEKRFLATANRFE
jgi:hypothetical protein